MEEQKELGIYIHIPFCMQKCYYCDFQSFEDKKDRIDEYINALKKEIKYEAENYKHYIIKTVYLGGGTPSAIEEQYIYEILNIIYKYYNISNEVEITMELNPGTLTKEKLQKYKEAKVNRLSIGLQTTSNQLLKQIGRIHTYEQFVHTYDLAKRVGFSNINVDLMIGLPNQTIQDMKTSLQQVIQLDITHISVYSLILEEDAKLSQMIKDKQYNLPSEETERNMYWYVKDVLELNGWGHYEISNFSKKGYESKHNLDCWNQKEYIGFGLAAHSYIDKRRYSNTVDLEEYIRKEKFELNRTIHEIQTKEIMEKEYMLLGLRKIEGVSIKEFKNKFIENPIYLFKDELYKLNNKRLIQIDIDTIKLTNKGIDLANIVWEEFV